MTEEAHLLHVQDLAVSLSRSDGNVSRVLQHISFSLKSGECLMIVGESGSGKTTLCRTLAGLLKPSCGQIYLKGKLLHPGGSGMSGKISALFFKGKVHLTRSLHCLRLLLSHCARSV